MEQLTVTGTFVGQILAALLDTNTGTLSWSRPNVGTPTQFLCQWRRGTLF